MRTLTRGFLPVEDPLIHLPPAFAEWQAVAGELSKLAITRHIRPAIEQLPSFPAEQLATAPQQERALSMLSYMGNLYVFAPNQPVATRLPANLARAWVAVADQLQRPPILTYASQVMYNWRRIDPNGPVAVDNLTLIQNFLGGMDEEWFATIHINIEAEASRGLQALQPAQAAVLRDDPQCLEQCLSEVAATLQTMHDILLRMTERCDPYIYYHRVRPYMFGWYGNPLLPEGMIYEGVERYGERPQQLRGETGAQSSVIYAFDALLGIEHEFDEMRAYLLDMRNYMPSQDRAVIETVEQGPSVRNYVLSHSTSHPSLRNLYNHCIEKLHQFRKLHIEYAALYIIKPAQGAGQGDVGTGGTPFTVYLKKHIKATAEHVVAK
ncbi:MAG: hypothetical protein U0175_18655 [Caldilineaceae bacterium]